ncbi:MAG TPA: sensor histidine kinase KdpD [Pirellulales bacterium]|nr:sensor histidine kinase KdpD [Pirellulales bacterium]
MSDRRRDPEALLRRVQAAEAKKARGKLKIFFGAAPGVGKTYTMLEAGREQAREGVDVLVGYIEPHVRPETQALVLGLDVLARKEVAYRGTKLIEFDLEAALVRWPQLILVDELAHTNAPGMTHAKRWQDVLQLLDAGISVFTTLNVQHLESLRDIVAQITGVFMAETVPDSAFEAADEVELVDLPVDGLLDRMREGKIYLSQQAERAIQGFFSKGNLIALRELALRKAAERVGAEMEDYREEHGVAGAWPVNERLLVCVGPGPFSARLVRATRRIAGSLKTPWIAVHVETPREARFSENDREQLSQTLNLAEQLGGETAMLVGHNLADELIHYASSRNVTRIIVGKPTRPRWKEWLQGSLVYDLTRRSGDIDIYVITGDLLARAAPAPQRVPAASAAGRYLAAFLMVVASTLVSWPLSYSVATANLIMVYLLGAVIVAARFGRGPSVLASLLSVAAFDYFFVPPVLTFAVQDTQYVLTFAVMLGTALTISTLTTRVSFQAESARKRERRTASLYAISHQLAAARTPEQIAQATVRHVGEAVDAKVTILLATANDRGLAAIGAEPGNFDPGPHDEAVARWAFDHGELAGHGTTTLPGSAGVYFPLRASHGVVGVLGVLPQRAWRPIDPERLHLLETLAGLIALAVERVQLAAEAARIRVQMETEKLRSSLLSAVSHDLRTPLAIITGAASTLLDGSETLALNLRRELLGSILDESDHLNRLVANLLDMTRLEAGAIEVHKDWQSLEEIVGAALARPLTDHPVITHLQAEMPFVPMDDLLIEQVLLNLLENAAKYSPPGTPIELTAFADGKLLTVEVADRGAGLPQADLPRVFEKFYRGTNSAGRPGAGLGLAICKGIIDLHGGQIEAENRPGGGAVLRFTLPLAATQPIVPPAVAPPET